MINMDICSKCGNPNIVIKRKASGQALCQDCFIESIEKKVIKTIESIAIIFFYKSCFTRAI